MHGLLCLSDRARCYCVLRPGLSISCKASLSRSQCFAVTCSLSETLCLQGSVPWNKGKKLSLETRLRMSLARKGNLQSKTTRRKISKAHTNLPVAPVQPHCTPRFASRAKLILKPGQKSKYAAHFTDVQGGRPGNVTEPPEHSSTGPASPRLFWRLVVAYPCAEGEQMGWVQETSAKVASALSGRLLTQEHKDAIAASQRRRLTATSILRAVEDVHSQQHASSPGSGAGYAPFATPYIVPRLIIRALVLDVLGSLHTNRVLHRVP